MGQKQKNEKIEGATGPGRTIRAREQIEKWNRMTALGFQRGKTPDAPGLQSGPALERLLRK